MISFRSPKVPAVMGNDGDFPNCAILFKVTLHPIHAYPNRIDQ